MGAPDKANELRGACLELALAVKWTQRPIDANEITSLADKMRTIAERYVSDGLSIDLPLIERAVRYITQAHGMPMGDDTDWFEYTLRALLEVARPNSGLEVSGKAFLLDMEQGIQSLLEGE
jgi:hypothetical protein